MGLFERVCCTFLYMFEIASIYTFHHNLIKNRLKIRQFKKWLIIKHLYSVNNKNILDIITFYLVIFKTKFLLNFCEMCIYCQFRTYIEKCIRNNHFLYCRIFNWIFIQLLWNVYILPISNILKKYNTRVQTNHNICFNRYT